MVGVSGAAERCAEALGDPDHHRVLTEDLGHRVRRAEAVLDREHDGVVAEERSCGRGGVADVRRLRGDHDALDGADPGRVRPRLELDDAVAARALDAEAVLPDRGDVLVPRVDDDHVVARGGEQRRVDGAHRPGADDGDAHRDRRQRASAATSRSYAGSVRNST